MMGCIRPLKKTCSPVTAEDGTHLIQEIEAASKVMKNIQ